MPLAGIILASYNAEQVPALAQQIARQRLRDASDPLSIPDSIFATYYRLNKEAFLIVLTEIEPFLPQSVILSILQLATTLRYLAVGSYQAVIGKDSDLNLHRTTVGKIVWRVLSVMERIICPKWITLELNEQDKQISKSHFYEHFRISEVVGCMYGTHIKISKPHAVDFKCLHVELPFIPTKYVKIINVCCALHNICRLYNLNFEAENLPDPQSREDDVYETSFDESVLHNTDAIIRNSIAQSLRR